DALFIAFFASAELGCFLELGWPLPAHVLDLYAETKWDTCGRDGMPSKPPLVFALDHYGVDSLDATEKDEMRQLALRGGPYSDAERRALLGYCESDVNALVRRNRSRAEGDTCLATSKLWPRFASAVESIVGDANRIRQVAMLFGKRPQTSRHRKCPWMPRSMCSKQIGGSAVRAEVGRTEAVQRRRTTA